MWNREKAIFELVELLKTIVLAAILALIIRSTVVEAYMIPSTSMVPTLKVGDRLLVNKLIYFFKQPKRFDVVVFEPPPEVSDDKIFIKRLIGLPGDTIEVKDEKLFINDKPVAEKYLNGPIRYNLPKIKVPEDQLFVMGDNRNHSYDSHSWGPLPQKNLLGKALIRYYPFQKAGSID